MIINISVDQYPRGPKSTWSQQVNDLIAEAESGKIESAYALLNWLQDINWPACGAASLYLGQNGRMILPRLKEVLRGNDEIWQANTIRYVIEVMPHDLIRELTPELVELTRRDDRAGANLSAANVLCNKHLCSRDELMEIVERVSRFNPDELDEMDEMRNLIK